MDISFLFKHQNHVTTGCEPKETKMKHKKYILFQFSEFYPCGGMNDLTGSFDTLAEARKQIKLSAYGHSEIVDRDTWTVFEDDN